MGENGNCSELDGSTALSEPGSDPGRTTGSTDIQTAYSKPNSKLKNFAVCLVDIWQPQMCLMIGDKSMIMIIIKLIQFIEQMGRFL